MVEAKIVQQLQFGTEKHPRLAAYVELRPLQFDPYFVVGRDLALSWTQAAALLHSDERLTSLEVLQCDDAACATRKNLHHKDATIPRGKLTRACDWGHVKAIDLGVDVNAIRRSHPL